MGCSSQKVKRLWFFGLALLLVLGIAVINVRRGGRSGPSSSAIAQVPNSLAQLLTSSETALLHCDIARRDLLCVEGLPGGASAVIDAQLSQLAAWAARIKSETARHW